MNEIRLIVNADDFGMSRGITDAIIVSHRYGFLTSASLMVNMPSSEYAASRSHDFPNLGLGVHLNICQGHPILPTREVGTLTDSGGRFHSPREMTRRLWMYRVASVEIEREFRAQIQWMKERSLRPSHADSHHHMHLYPAAARAFVRALEAEGISCARACVCAEWPQGSGLGGPYKGGILRRELVQIYRRLLQSTIFRGLGTPEWRIAIRTGRGRRGTLQQRWKSTFEHLTSGTFELACHPGLFEHGFSEADAIHARREEELLCLTDRDLLDVIERKSIQLVTYRDLSSRESAQTISPPAAA